MQELLMKIPDIVQVIALLGMVVSILATIVVRLTPSTTDDEKVSAIITKFMKVLQWLPTIGVNPQTKKLQEAYEELKAKQDANKPNS
jgi:predicted PurR-regulated permease PerM